MSITPKECAQELTVSGPDKRIDGAEKFCKELHELQVVDSKAHNHVQEYTASALATKTLVDNGGLPDMKIDGKQAVFVAGGTADKKGLVISVGRDSGQKDVVVYEKGGYYAAKRDGNGHYVMDESRKIGNEQDFEKYAKKELGLENTQDQHRKHGSDDAVPAFTQKLDSMSGSMHSITKEELDELADRYGKMTPEQRRGALQAIQKFNEENQPRTASGWYITPDENNKNHTVIFSAERTRDDRPWWMGPYQEKVSSEPKTESQEN